MVSGNQKRWFSCSSSAGCGRRKYGYIRSQPAAPSGGVISEKYLNLGWVDIGSPTGFRRGSVVDKVGVQFGDGREHAHARIGLGGRGGLCGGGSAREHQADPPAHGACQV